MALNTISSSAASVNPFSPSVLTSDALVAQIEEALTNGKFLAGTQMRVEEMAFFGYVAEAAALLNDLRACLRLSPQFPLRYPEQYHVLRDIMVVLQWAVFHTIKDEEVAVNLFAHHLMRVLRLDGFNIWEKVKLWFLTYPLLDDRDRLKARLRDALEKNREQFGSSSARGSVGVDAAPRSLTIGQWIERVATQIGRKRYTPLAINAFLNTDEWARRLDGTMQEQLRTLITLYGHLLMPSLSVEGIEETIPIDEADIKGTIRQGRFEEIHESQLARIQRDLASMRSIISSTHSNVLIEKYEQWARDPSVAAARAQLVSMPVQLSHKDAVKLLQGWLEAVNKKEVQKGMTGLWTLARAGKVREVFADSARYREYWHKHLPPALKEKEGEFEKDPAAPQFLVGFLRHILVERMKLTDESAKMIILTLSNEARKAGEEEYAHMAYGDLKTGEFRWNT